MRIGVIGGGAWGTALAQVAAHDRRDVLLWAREPEVVDSINADHENRSFLAGVALSPTIRATGSLADLADCEALLVVAPAQHVRGVLAETPVGTTPLVLCAKGIEAGTRLLVGEVARQVHGARQRKGGVKAPSFQRRGRQMQLSDSHTRSLRLRDLQIGGPQ